MILCSLTSQGDSLARQGDSLASQGDSLTSQRDFLASLGDSLAPVQAITKWPWWPRSLHDFTFPSLRHLRSLDLSHTLLRRVGPDTFNSADLVEVTCCSTSSLSPCSCMVAAPAPCFCSCPLWHYSYYSCPLFLLVPLVTLLLLLPLVSVPAPCEPPEQVLSLADNQLHRLDPAAFRALANLKRCHFKLICYCNCASF